MKEVSSNLQNLPPSHFQDIAMIIKNQTLSFLNITNCINSLSYQHIKEAIFLNTKLITNHLSTHSPIMEPIFAG